MSTELVIVFISTGASLVISIMSAWFTLHNQRKLEKAKSELEQEKLEKNARRDYEYAAKKRLYESYEPLLFQLSELSDMAYSRLEGIAKNTKEGTRLDAGVWHDFESHYFRTTIYNLLAPLAIFRLIQKRITFADFRIEESVYLQYSLIKMLFYSFADDFKLARMRNLPEDRIYFEKWKEQHKTPDPNFVRQGLQSNKIDVLTSAFLVSEGESIRLLSFAEFEAGLENAHGIREKIQEGFDLFKGFHPEKKSILWGILLVHACIHSFIIKTTFHRDFNPEMLKKHIETFFTNNPDLSWTSEETEISRQTLEAAKKYLLHTLNKRIKY